jgi:hypothetical protein
MYVRNERQPTPARAGLWTVKILHRGAADDGPGGEDPTMSHVCERLPSVRRWQANTPRVAPARTGTQEDDVGQAAAMIESTLDWIRDAATTLDGPLVIAAA